MSTDPKTVKPSLEMAQKFVSTATGQENPTIRVRLIHDRDKSKAAVEESGHLSDLWPYIERGQGEGYGVFWIPLFTGFQTDDNGYFVRDKDAVYPRLCFCDFDKNGLPKEWHRQPQIIVTSSPGKHHAYWLVETEDVDAWKVAQRRLIARYPEADKTIKNPSRLMRLPGTLHLKGEPYLVTFAADASADEMHIGVLAIPTLDQLCEGLPAVPDAAHPWQADGPVETDKASNVATGRARMGHLLKSGQVAVEGHEGDNLTYKICCELVRDLGLSVETAFDVMQDWNAACKPPWPEEELRAKLQHAAAYGQNDPGAKANPPASEAFDKMPHVESPEIVPVVPALGQDVITLPRHLRLHSTAEELRKIPLPDYSRGRAENTVLNATTCIGALKIGCAYDVFHGQKFVSGMPFGSSVCMVNDLVAHLIRRVCLEVWQVEFTQSKMYDALIQCCLVNQYNPVTDYLAGLKWDGIPRLDTWLIDLFGVADTPYARAVSKIILIAAVRRARKPGTKFDQCVVLEGPEGKNKSTAIRHMAEAAGPGNFSDAHILTLDQKQQMELLRGTWLYEIADLTGLRKAEIEKVKSFMSKQEDRARAAYDRDVTNQYRQCVFFATTNDDDYLQSTTGNRRWWPLKTTKECDLDKLDAMRDQLWAEAAHEEADGASIVLPKELWPFAAKEQELRRTRHPWEDYLVNVSGTKVPLGKHDNTVHEERIHASDLYSRYLRIEPGQQNGASGKTVKAIMLRIGWEYKPMLRIGGRTGSGYVRTVEGPMPEPPADDAALPDDPMEREGAA